MCRANPLVGTLIVRSARTLNLVHAFSPRSGNRNLRLALPLLVLLSYWGSPVGEAAHSNHSRVADILSPRPDGFSGKHLELGSGAGAEFAAQVPSPAKQPLLRGSHADRGALDRDGRCATDFTRHLEYLVDGAGAGVEAAAQDDRSSTADRSLRLRGLFFETGSSQRLPATIPHPAAPSIRAGENAPSSIWTYCSTGSANSCWSTKWA